MKVKGIEEEQLTISNIMLIGDGNVNVEFLGQ